MTKKILEPSYFKDVTEVGYANFENFPGEGEPGKIYIAMDTDKAYRFNGNEYVEFGSGGGGGGGESSGLTIFPKPIFLEDDYIYYYPYTFEPGTTEKIGLYLFTPPENDGEFKTHGFTTILTNTIVNLYCPSDIAAGRFITLNYDETGSEIPEPGFYYFSK